jgi:putative transposase
MIEKNYPTDLNDSEWEEIKQYLPKAKKIGRPREVDLRKVLNAIFYQLKTGTQWNYLPKDFPPKGTVYWYFKKFKEEGIIENLHNILRDKVREKLGKNIEPSASIIDSQSVKTTIYGEEIGFDAGKLIKGRKRHILVDTQGLLLKVIVTSASVQDRDGAKIMLDENLKYFHKLELTWADSAYAGKLIEHFKDEHGHKVEIIKRTDDMKGFILLPRRWVVERTFSWLNNYRRLSKDYERLTNTSETLIYFAMIRLMLKRLA